MVKDTQILYMEDDEGTARLLQRKFQAMGYTVVIVPDGETGLEKSSSQVFDVIVVDQNMPGISGIQVIEKLTQRDNCPPIIMLTGSGNEKIAVEAMKLGASDYMVKDIDLHYLDLMQPVIEQALTHRQALEDKRRAESALHKSEERFRSVVEQSYDGIVLVDEHGKIVEWNHAEEKITGIRRQDALGKNIWDVTYQTLPQSKKTEATRQQFIESFQQIRLEEHASWERTPLEYEIEQVDGSLRIVQSVKFLIKQEDYFLVADVTRDITEQKRMESALRESEERFRTIFEEAPDAYFIYDMEGNFVDGNRSAEVMIRTARDELIGKNMIEAGLLSEDQLDKAASIIENTLEGNSSGPNEFTLYPKNLAPIDIEVRAFPTLISGDIKILSIARDITWRKQTEAQIVTYVQQLETLHAVDNELTQKLDIKYVQQMALDTMMRLSESDAGVIAVVDNGEFLDVYSRGYSDTFDPKDSIYTRSIVARVLKTGKPEFVEDVRTDSGYTEVLEDTSSQICMPLISQDRIVGIVTLETKNAEQFTHSLYDFLQLIAGRVASAVDNAMLFSTTQQHLTELQELYEQIQKLEQLKTDMIRVVTHDLGSPLATIATSMYLLEHTLKETVNEDQLRYFKRIRNSIERMKSLTTDVLSLEKIENLANDNASMDEVNLIEVVQVAVDNARLEGDRKNQQIELSYPNQSIMVRGNKTEFEQAVSNLINNAVKYTPEEMQIDVVLQVDNDTIRFEVIDCGYGIPEDKHANLFQPFERVKTDETRDIEGTGLGLYIVKTIVERNNGEIVFSSQYGQGSTFGFVLPMLTQI